jgi:hypothetical protein
LRSVGCSLPIRFVYQKWDLDGKLRSKLAKFPTMKEAGFRFYYCFIFIGFITAMTPFNNQQEQVLTAFLTALSQQDEALPEGLQKQLHAIGQNLEARIAEIPAMAASLPSLNQAYQAALVDAQTHSTDAGVTFVSANSNPDTKLRDRAVQILTDTDPVQAAQRHRSRGLGTQIASNPLKRFFGRG